MSHLTVSITKKDHVQGHDIAPITLVEYGDYQCPYCGRAYPIVKQIQESLGKNLRFVFRNFPLKSAHPYAYIAASAAEAAALQNKFWEMHDAIYENQPLLTPEFLLTLAEQLNLDIPKFEKDMQSSVVKEKIDEDFKNGIRSGVNGTPCFFINDMRYDGEVSIEALEEALRAD